MERKALCFMIHGYNLQHEGPQGGLSIEGEHSSMVEDTPTTVEHGHRRHVMGNIQGTVLRELSIRVIH